MRECSILEIKIYTTYFAKLKKLPRNIVPVSICRYPPSGFKGIQYKKLAPTGEILSSFKNNEEKSAYIEQYNEEILSKCNVHEVMDDLLCMTGLKGGPNGLRDSIALVCFEKPEDFCHRHLVADWFKQNGYDVTEY